MGLNVEMIVLAREAAGWTQGALANAVGISQAQISKIEHGLEDPNESVLNGLALHCGVPRHFFDQQITRLGESLIDIFHKKRLTLPAKPLKRANALANVICFEARRALNSIEFTDPSPFPSFSIDEHGSPDEIAALVRATWRIAPGPLPDLVALIEDAAVPVYVVPLGHDKLSAISLPGTANGHVVVLNRDLPPSARRFALAHELGHLVMHNGTGSEDMEKDADAFASALLMPANDIRHRLQNIRFRDLGALKPVWKVSLAALIRRAHSLGAITDRHYRTLNIQLNKLPGGRKREPGEFPAEYPRLMRRVIEHYQQNLGYSWTDLEGLLVATEGTLRERYFDEPARTLRAVGSDSPIQMPMRG